MNMHQLYVGCDKDPTEDEDEASDDEQKEEEMKELKETNKLGERDAALRSSHSPQTSANPDTLALTVDVKNNVEKGSTLSSACVLFCLLCFE